MNNLGFLKMTAKEIIDYLEKSGIKPRVLFDADFIRWNCTEEEEEATNRILSELGNIEFMGYEIQDTDSFIFRVELTDQDIILQTNLYYSSYEGMYWNSIDWSSVYEVFPVQETVTVYKREK